MIALPAAPPWGEPPQGNNRMEIRTIHRNMAYRSTGVWQMTRKVVLVLVLLGMLVASAGCNTVRGIGRDISAVGDALSDAAGNPE